ncbi:MULTISPECIES: endonuclease/exonuclease/phosphatase family protein [Marinovum]|uniref:endonuclease/exonuclease/phosphatase family protein n=1 Tax=Marinovum TaxID=367771 RepID=UPI00237B47C7|nr:MULTISPECIES: endonuclease/exonuclease/phosphatase family protein [Marinovum]MDD9741182.1 endonuclease/exonuclease/phosphatase family protein [Marinovum sp. SP66]
MRIATYNVEWFDALFDDAGRLLADDAWSARHEVTRREQIEALAIVLTALDADAVMVIEAPDSHRARDGVRALETFAATFGLRARRAVIGFTNTTQQEIALLYDPDALRVRHDPRDSAGAPRFDGTFEIDLDFDARRDRVRFSKPPLELAVETAGGQRLRMIGAHLKSKAPHGAKTRDQIMRLSIANRRKQLAQAIWLRQRVEEHLAAGESLIVLGDLNDGPGLDEYEALFGRSSVEIIRGEGRDGPRLYDPNASIALQRRLGAQPTTARFYIAGQDSYLQALLDYIFVSPDLCARRPDWRIWHPFNDPACWRTRELREALVTASDHYPVTLDIAI